MDGPYTQFYYAVMPSYVYLEKLMYNMLYDNSCSICRGKGVINPDTDIEEPCPFCSKTETEKSEKEI